MTRGSTSAPRAGIATACLSVVAFLTLFHYVGHETWGHGKITFVRMLGIATVLLVAPRMVKLEERIGTSRLLGLGALAVSAVLAFRMFVELRTVLGIRVLRGSAVDIAQNVYEAGTQFLAGKNPYTEHCQLGHRIPPGPNVTVTAAEVRMYGLHYPYGFPYFPTMMLAYLPFRPLAEGLHSVRVGNAFYLALGTVGACWLAARSVAAPHRTLAAGLAALASLGIDVIAPEHFRLAVTDVCIATVAVYAFVALSYDRYVLAGVLLGLAQGAKLLPGPLLALPAVAYAPDARARLRLGAAYAVTSLAFVVPALAADPEAFIASTIAFYLTYHAGGDDTALYFFLPDALKSPFLVVGAALALTAAAWGFKRRPASVAAAGGLAWLAYFVFTQWNRMTHLNYLWSVHALGAAAIASAALPARHATTRSVELAERPDERGGDQ